MDFQRIFLNKNLRIQQQSTDVVIFSALLLIYRWCEKHFWKVLSDFRLAFFLPANFQVGVAQTIEEKELTSLLTDNSEMNIASKLSSLVIPFIRVWISNHVPAKRETCWWLDVRWLHRASLIIRARDFWYWPMDQRFELIGFSIGSKCLGITVSAFTFFL